MSKDQNDNVQFTAADISRYLQGQMAPAEMYALEKAALEDPFLADAIEGYGERTDAGESNLNLHLDDLRQRLKKRIREDDKKIIPVYKAKWWQIAAVLVLLAGSGTLVYTLINNSTESRRLSVAKNESKAIQDTSSEKASLEQPITSADSTAIALNDKPASEPEAFSLQKSKIKTNAPALVKRAAAPPAAGVLSEQEADRTIAGKSEKNIAAASSREKTFDEAAPVERKILRATSEEGPVLYFRGKVISKDDKPVPGASVVISGKNESIATDSNGNFNFSLPDTIAAVAVNAVGFETTKTTIRSNVAISSIKLTESNNDLNDIVVTGYGKRKQSNVQLKKISDKNLDAEPEIGFTEYNKYIENNKRMSKHSELCSACIATL